VLTAENGSSRAARGGGERCADYAKRPSTFRGLVDALKERTAEGPSGVGSRHLIVVIREKNKPPQHKPRQKKHNQIIRDHLSQVNYSFRSDPSKISSLFACSSQRQVIRTLHWKANPAS